MIWPVSTLLRRNGTPTPAWVENLSMVRSLSGPGGLEVGGRAEGPAHGRGRGDGHRHQVRAPALALAALEVPVGGGGAALAGRELVGVHAEAHGAAGTAPLTARLLEDHVEALLL